MKAGISSEFRVNRERHISAALNSNNALGDTGCYLYPAPGRGYQRCTDENRVECTPIQAFYGNIRFEGFFLPPESIPVNGHLHKSQRADTGIVHTGRHQYHAGAGSKDAPGESSDRFEEVVFLNKPGDSSRFATGNGKLHSSRSAGLLTSKTSEEEPGPIRSSARRNASICSLTFPCSASTPILASTGLQHLIVPEGVDIETGHGVTEASADLCNHRGVFEMVDRFHNCLCHTLGAR